MIVLVRWEMISKLSSEVAADGPYLGATEAGFQLKCGGAAAGWCRRKTTDSYISLSNSRWFSF